MRGRTLLGFDAAGKTALVPWAAMLMIGICCPLSLVTSDRGAPCHAPVAPFHCVGSAIEQPADTWIEPDPGLPHIAMWPNLASMDVRVGFAGGASLEVLARRGRATFLLDQQLLI